MNLTNRAEKAEEPNIEPEIKVRQKDSFFKLLSFSI